MSSPDNGASGGVRNDATEYPGVNSVDALFQKSLNTMWTKLNDLVGKTATEALFRSAWSKAQQDHPFLSQCDFSHGGMSIECDDKTHLPGRQLFGGYLAFYRELTELLIDLTGDVLARRVTPLVDEFSRDVEELSDHEEGES